MPIITRPLNKIESDLLDVIIKATPIQPQEIEIAYRKLNSIDKVILAANLSAYLNLDFRAVVAGMTI
ncbi:MAG: hypothetical protein GTN53_22995 [Candidatus Aminicenantes bacterium]|nr:hypothetical protein [Candidatus Aminicenantes bacterium]NIQ69371.1 hypothetical protein [Candidatus Aminicenantes bacterium]NIT25372.1 hypothetical protein [Candidatus Aminicenantes bacterium]